MTVNLAPAAVRKEGPAYDLPIAVGILVATGQIPAERIENALMVGELSLDGSVRHVKGLLPIAAVARDHGIQRVFAPAVDAPEAALIPDLEVIPVNSLAELRDYLCGGLQIPQTAYTPPDIIAEISMLTDFADIKGQEHVKRAFEVAVAGGHNLLMSGARELEKPCWPAPCRGFYPK